MTAPRVVACVWTGDRYGVEYVERLRNMVRRHAPGDTAMLCYTDRPNEVPDGIHAIGIPKRGFGWWGKMFVFATALRDSLPLVYLDLDTVVVDSLEPLLEWQGEFAICANFTRAAGHPTWPCRYGSCVMCLGPDFGADIYRGFIRDADRLMGECRHGDQELIERFVPEATILQDVMPPGYFVGYRDLGNSKPDGAAVVVFAGSSKPHNCRLPWVQEAWQ